MGTLHAGMRIGPYEVVSPLGSGGMGEVYRASDSRLGRSVAIKVLPQHLSQDVQALVRFEREAKSIAALSHPNILAIFDVGTEQGISYAVTELLEGETLRARLTLGPMAWRKAAGIGAALADGLAAAHSKGIIHRDLKPGNIFLTSDGRVKILDFGLALFRPPDAPADEAPTQAQTEAGMVMGTVGYMSPEQVRGSVAEAPSDLFSLGCVLHEMMSGHRTFGRPSTAETMAAILHGDPSALSGAVPPEFEQVILRCLEKNQFERFQSARDLAFRLREIAGGSGSGQTALPPDQKLLNSLAVLPFANAGGDPEAEYFSDGITETIINNLSQLGKLRVAARTTVFRYKGRDTDPQAVGRELKVRAVLTGKVVQRGDSLRIQVELVDAADGSQLWGQRYNRKVADVFAIEEEIAREISDTLRLRLTGAEQQQLGKRYTENNEAYQLYLKGRYYWNRRATDSLKRAVACLEQAIERDPGYALAWSALAECYVVYGAYDVLSPRTVLPKAREAALKALDLDDSLAEPHACLGVVKAHYDFDWAGAESELQRAVDLNPNSTTAHIWLTMCLSPLGRTDEAVMHARRGLEIEPLSLGVHIALGASLVSAGRYREATEVQRKAIELDAGFAAAHWWLALTYGQMGLSEDALATLQEARRLFEGSPLIMTALGRVYAATNRREDAEKILHEAVVQSETRYVPPYYIALVYLGLGQTDQAIEWLEKSREDRSFWFIYSISSAIFASVRSDPRFHDVLRRMKLEP